MPTDALATFRDALLETEAYGFDRVRDEQIALGTAIRELLEARGVKSVAADGFKAQVLLSATPMIESEWQQICRRGRADCCWRAAGMR